MSKCGSTRVNLLCRRSLGRSHKEAMLMAHSAFTGGDEDTDLQAAILES